MFAAGAEPMFPPGPEGEAMRKEFYGAKVSAPKSVREPSVAPDDLNHLKGPSAADLASPVEHKRPML